MGKSPTLDCTADARLFQRICKCRLEVVSTDNIGVAREEAWDSSEDGCIGVIGISARARNRVWRKDLFGQGVGSMQNIG